MDLLQLHLKMCLFEIQKPICSLTYSPNEEALAELYRITGKLTQPALDVHAHEIYENCGFCGRLSINVPIAMRNGNANGSLCPR